MEKLPEKKYKIVHLSYTDSTGGAAIAAYRLHSEMIKNGIDSSMVVMEKGRKEKTIFELNTNPYERITSRAKTYITLNRHSFSCVDRGLYSDFSLGCNVFKHPLVKSADIIYLHWVNYAYINITEIERLLKHGKKVFWYMHDMFPITGGCHHSFECNGFQKDCKECPFFAKKNKSFSNKQLQKKKRLLKYSKMNWIAPSRWLYACAEKSVCIDAKRLYLIPNIISDKFFQLNKQVAKEALGLEKDKTYILFGADGVVENPYKGWNYFVEVINYLFSKIPNKNIIEIILFGASESETIKKTLPFRCNFIGEIKDEYTMNLLYNASNVFLCTSIAENYPLTVQESIACGTKVVAFDVGGISDLIDGKNGKLLPLAATEEMADVIVDYTNKTDQQLIKNYYDINTLEWLNKHINLFSK